MADSSNFPSMTVEGERRQATIMFADISGFTSMAEKLDAEELTGITNDCFTLLGSIITNYGGTIDKYMGDCVMAVFGAPKAIEGAPRKAIEAALVMREEIAAFNKKRQLVISLDMHIGINSGEVVTGEVGSETKKEYTVMGDAVNLAARLKDISEKGEILVGPITYRYTRTQFDFEPLKPVLVKGKTDQIPVYRVVSERERKAEEPTLGRMIQSELVGRERERNQVELQIKKVINGEGSIVNLIGEAGIGKSRLCAEVYREPYMERVTLLEGRALSVGRTLSYYPVIEILKHWAAITEEDEEQRALFKLESSIRTVIPDQADEVIPFIATLMGYKLIGAHARRMEGVSGESLGKLIAKNLKDLIVRACTFKPLVFVLEDLHWADESTFELVQSLMGMVESHPVMFLNVYRSGYEETTEKFHKRIVEEYPGRVEDIRVEPLEPAESEQLTWNLLRAKGFPEPTITQIVERSGGNPFYIEEVIRALIDTGAVRAERDGFVAGKEFETVTLPNSINEVIMARIDRMDEQTRELLRIASVIGRSFFHRILVQVMGEREEIEDRIEGLKAMQLLRERMRMEELEYLFKHALAQEAVYHSILLKKRKRLHLRVAEAIEKSFSERLSDFYGMLAFHFLQGEDADRAEEYLEKAGEAALESAASSEALIYYQRAIELYKNKMGATATPERLAKLEKNIATAYNRKGQYIEAIQHYNAALAYLGRKRTHKFNKLLAAALGFLRSCRYAYIPITLPKYHFSERKEEIMHLEIERAFAWALMDASEMFINGLTLAGYFFGRNAEKSNFGFRLLSSYSAMLAGAGFVKLSSKILKILEPHQKDEFDRYTFLDAEQWLNFCSGERSCVYHGDIVDYFLKHGDFSRVNFYLCFWGWRFIYKGEFQRATEIAEKLQAIAKDYDNDASLLIYHEILTGIYTARNDTSAAIQEADKLIGLTQSIGERSVMKTHLSKKLQLLLKKGDLEEAEILAEEIHLLLEEERVFITTQAIPAVMSIVSYYTLRLSNERDQRRRTPYRKTLKTLLKKLVRKSKKLAINHSEACRIAGTGFWVLGRQRKALELWQKGLREADQCGQRLFAGELALEIGRRLSEPGSRHKTLDSKSAEYYLLSAQETFADLGLERKFEV